MNTRMRSQSARLGWLRPTAALKVLLLPVWLLCTWATLQAYETVPDGKYWETGGYVYYVRSSQNNLYVDDGTNTGNIIDATHWYRRVGEAIIIESVPCVGFTTGSYWSSGSYYVQYKTWTDSNTGYKWGKFWAMIWDDTRTWEMLWGNGLTINLQASNGQYVSAEGGGGQNIVANRYSAYAWEELTVWPTQGGYFKNGDEIVMASRDYLKILCAEGGGGQNIVANRDAVGGWERFHVYKLSGGDEYIRSGDQVALMVDNGQYWRAENGGGGAVNAINTTIGSWETFTWTFVTPEAR